MSLSRKNYEAIAEIIEAQTPAKDRALDDWDNGFLAAVNNISEALCVYFEGDNANFDPNRFLKACGVQS
jgi:hypothetical protein